MFFHLSQDQPESNRTSATAPSARASPFKLHRRPSADSKLAGSRPQIKTLAPSRARRSATSKPIPRAPPVMNAALPSSSQAIWFLLYMQLAEANDHLPRLQRFLCAASQRKRTVRSTRRFSFRPFCPARIGLGPHPPIQARAPVSEGQTESNGTPARPH